MGLYKPMFTSLRGTSDRIPGLCQRPNSLSTSGDRQILPLHLATRSDPMGGGELFADPSYEGLSW